ncbi:putative membrane protein [Nitrosomonas aestuarii]|uniref:Putative membrane protein n=1 Tax=Nitrosomonas aestuarii TaxID=52441 RepID=A0A1I3ZS30_9PROT|nr:bestrophin family ion channel [Nitrosomonas aestuarii]SFK46700.1 putative membrane protein [Nitrosomonas aestuarii]
MIVQRTIRLSDHIKVDGGNVLFFIAYGCLVCILHLIFTIEYLAFPISEINVLGIAVAILLGFRNNEAYNRYWEARSAWGDLTNASRNFAAQITGYVQPPQKQEHASPDVTGIHSELIYRHLAFLNALRLQLRQEVSWEELTPFLSDQEFQALSKAANKATLLNQWQSRRLQELYRSGWIERQAYIFGLMESIKAFFAAQGVCERIKTTPLPRQYGLFTKAFVWIFVLLLPLGLVQQLGWVTLPISVILSTIFTVTEHIGSRTEEPFSREPEDVAMLSICRNIEIDLRQQLGESSIPTPLEVKDGVLM